MVDKKLMFQVKASFFDRHFCVLLHFFIYTLLILSIPLMVISIDLGSAAQKILFQVPFAVMNYPAAELRGIATRAMLCE